MAGDPPPQEVDLRDPAAIVLEVEAAVLTTITRAFRTWAAHETGGAEALHLAYTPHKTVAIDHGDRCGLVVDEVFLASVWIGRGGEAFVALLDGAVDRPGSGIRSIAPEDQPHLPLLVPTVLSRGLPIAQVPRAR